MLPKNLYLRIMMMKVVCIHIIIYFLISLPFTIKAQNQVPFTLEDRDRIIRMEEKIESLEKEIGSLRNEINARFEAMDQKFPAMDEKFAAMDEKIEAMDEKFESKFNTLFTLIYFVLGGIMGLIGFVLWDRRTFIKPFKDRVNDVEDKNTRIINSLREQAKNNPSLAEILKNTGVY